MLEITPDGKPHTLLIMRRLLEAGASFYLDRKGRIRVREEDWARISEAATFGATIRRLGDWRDVSSAQRLADPSRAG